jgi:hypothetical protein
VTEEIKKSAPDLIFHARGIAKYLNMTVRQAEHLIEKRQIPVGKLSARRIYTTAEALDAYLLGQIHAPKAA